jgi:hypothetical protein
MAVSFAIESWIEGGVVTAIILLNVVIGFFQEFNAEKTMDSLRSLSSPTASAVRDGKTVTVPTIEVVVGDLVEMKTGDTVPADVRYAPPQHNMNPLLTLHAASSKLSTLKPTRLFSLVSRFQCRKMLRRFSTKTLAPAIV